MARTLPILVLLVVTLAALGIGYAGFQPAAAAKSGPPGQNDAGSGQDAGDTPDLALRVDGARHAWSANLTPPGSDADWYSRDATSAFCAVGSATTNAPGLLTLASDELRQNAARLAVAPHDATSLALAAPAGRRPYLGLEPLSLVQTYGGSTGGPPSPGRYTFELATLTLADLDPEGDGETPEAGATAATSAPLPEACAAGQLGTTAADLEDRYHFDINGPVEMTFSFALAGGAAAQAIIVSPTGATRATLASGDAVSVWTDEPGRWTLVVAYESGALAPALGLALPPLPTTAPSTATLTDYLLAITAGPDPEPCRPTCRR